eukprot:g33597.t1
MAASTKFLDFFENRRLLTSIASGAVSSQQCQVPEDAPFPDLISVSKADPKSGCWKVKRFLLFARHVAS